MNPKIKVDRELFSDVLKKAYKFVPKNTTIPAFDNFKITVNEGRMRIVGADANCQAILSCEAKGSDVSFCAPADLLVKTIELYRENEVIITIKDKGLIELKCGKGKHSLTSNCMPDDFPVMTIRDITDEMVVHQFYLKMGLKSAEVFMGDNETQARAQGFRVNEIDGRVVFTGLDGFTLCRVNVKPVSISSWSNDMIMASETAKKVMSLLSDKGDVTMVNNKDKVQFFSESEYSGNFEVTATLLNSGFPNTEGLMKHKGADFVEINTLEFRDAVKRLNLYANVGNTPRITIETHSDNINEIILTADDPMFGKSGEESMTITNVCGKKFKKAFNGNFLLKILYAIEENEIRFFFHENDKVACFIDPKVDESKENNFNFLIQGLQ